MFLVWTWNRHVINIYMYIYIYNRERERSHNQIWIWAYGNDRSKHSFICISGIHKAIRLYERTTEKLAVFILILFHVFQGLKVEPSVLVHHMGFQTIGPGLPWPIINYSVVFWGEMNGMKCDDISCPRLEGCVTCLQKIHDSCRKWWIDNFQTVSKSGISGVPYFQSKPYSAWDFSLIGVANVDFEV